MSNTDIFDTIHTIPPVDTRFRLGGRWHHDRITLQGFKVEAKVFLRGLTQTPHKNRRFLIVGRARSGTTLLRRLLNDHSKIRCDGEMLKMNLISPAAHFHRLANKAPEEAYGAKFLSYQMVQVHRMRNPGAFLKRLHEDGVLLIHLQRDTFFQNMSLAVAQSRKRFHNYTGAHGLTEAIWLDPDIFVRRFTWNDALLRYENAAFEGIDHLELHYERDLATPDQQVQTVNRLCAALDLPPEEVQANIAKALPTDPANVIENYAEIRTRLEDAGFGHLLPPYDG